ncbi:MAG TPA: J domain-containing protein [Candidatus Hydrogenedentes bacterium]|mgnify:FL=1|jgi:hypothetical protein|nr:J domain-containing protein [Candidatus Hydrogenedentota bacterium]HPJ98728.1 J domain-containing protein [Candidatus Hydrogenedentota bacterium]
MAGAGDGYINFYEILGLDEDAKPGEVRKVYRRRMKELVGEIARVEITQQRRARYLLEMAQLNAALLVLRESDTREAYWSERQALIDLEQKWRDAVAEASDGADALRRQFDGRLQTFLSKYCEEWMLAAGQDKECVENSHWDAAHTRHASRILRFYRNDLYQKILERLPYAEVTPPAVDWEERARFVRSALDERN